MVRPVSVLDLSPIDSGSTAQQALQNTIAMARIVEALGYHRFWMAEHHNTRAIASSAPEIMIGHVADATSTIRVGSGGIMLPNHAALKVAENFRVLEALHPGRIDLGIGRAPGTDQITAMALRRPIGRVGADDFPEQLSDVIAFAGGGFPDDHPFRSVMAAPDGVDLPPIWILGSSDYGARLAAAWGLRFAFAGHISPDGVVPVMSLYRDNFQPSQYLSEPHSMLALAVICGETDEEAEYLAGPVRLSFLKLITGRHGPVVSPEEAATYTYTPYEHEQIRGLVGKWQIGGPETVAAKVNALAEATAADEIMLTTMVYSHAARRRTYEHLAPIFGIAQITPAA